MPSGGGGGGMVAGYGTWGGSGGYPGGIHDVNGGGGPLSLGAADAKAAAALAAITTLAADHIGFCLGVWAVKPRDASVAAASPGPPRGAVTTDTTRATGATVAAITE